MWQFMLKKIFHISNISNNSNRIVWVFKILFCIWPTYELHTINIWMLTIYISIVGFEPWSPKLETKPFANNNTTCFFLYKVRWIVFQTYSILNDTKMSNLEFNVLLIIFLECCYNLMTFQWWFFNREYLNTLFTCFETIIRPQN